MRSLKYLMVLTIVFVLGQPVYALEGERTATEETIAQLKRDLYAGNLQVGKTRVKDIVSIYGKPGAITDDDRRVIFNYGDLTIEFSKQQRWEDWEYDTFKETVYTDDVDDLRYDLESKELVGNNITLDTIRNDYGIPTESFPKEEDGQLSVYYYGDIKLIFENEFILKRWRSAKLDENPKEEVFTNVSKEEQK